MKRHDTKPRRNVFAGFDASAGGTDPDRLTRLRTAITRGREASGSPASDGGTSDGDGPADAALVSRRLRIAAIAVALLFVCLIGRVFSLQVIQHDQYAEAWRQSEVRETVPAVRGSITDRNGEIYAITKLTGKSLYAVPRLLAEPRRGQLARLLAGELGLDAGALHDRFRRYHDKHFVWVKRRLTDAEELTLARLVDADPALGFRDETQRIYPQGRTLANALGFVGIDGEGLEGIERRFDALLAGEDGSRLRVRDAHGARISSPDLPATPPTHGAGLALTIDHLIQSIVEDELDRLCADWEPKGVSALVMNPHTGEILAMATRPTFDPGNRRGSSPADWRNRAITDVFEPGSIIKPGILLAAVEAGHFRIGPRESTIHCENGAWRIRSRNGRASRVLHDVHGYGGLTLGEVLIKSSNIGMAKIGRALGYPALLETIRQLGYGTRLGIGIAGENPGMLPPDENYPEVFTVPSVAMGHSIGLTPLQMLTGFNAVANGGFVLRPTIVSHATDTEGRVIARTPLPQVLARPFHDPSALAWMRETLAGVCRRGGTASRANLDKYGITMAGKTGTAEKVVNGQYSSEHKVCSFVAFAPADAPVISVLVTVDEPTVHFENKRFYGGTVAAPAVRNVILRALRMRGLAAGTD